jgi:phospholipid-translocating ATPase
VDTNHVFLGAISISGNQKLPLTLKQVLLRGCVLRNTDWCVGVAVYVGEQTKLMLNSMYVQYSGPSGYGELILWLVVLGIPHLKKAHWRPR